MVGAARQSVCADVGLSAFQGASVVRARARALIGPGLQSKRLGDNPCRPTPPSPLEATSTMSSTTQEPRQTSLAHLPALPHNMTCMAPAAGHHQDRPIPGNARGRQSIYVPLPRFEPQKFSTPPGTRSASKF